jgi:peptidoglycan-associated lipoprotein
VAFETWIGWRGAGVTLALLSGVLLSACASHPKPMLGPAPPPPAVPSAPGPMRPAPPPPVASSVLPGSERDFVVNVGDRVYFDTDQYNVRADAEPVLTSQASWLARYPAVQVRIEGNCDERGTREYNLALGARRASAIKAFLVARGVAPSRIATISYGKERPIDAGSGDAAWAHNRNGHTDVVSGAR